MTIKKRLVLGATTTFCALALTVPMTFAACPVNSDCANQQATPIVTPDNATCEKCHKSPCACEKKSFFDGMFNKKDDCGCQTGAAAPCGCEEKKPDCGCEEVKPDCGCEQKKDDCGCTTGAAAPCIETKPLNQQTYAYPNAIYSQANQAQVGEALNGAEISDSLLVPNQRSQSANCACTGAAAPINMGVPVECDCPTGGAAPVINSNDLPKYNCEAAPNVYSTTTMDVISVSKTERIKTDKTLSKVFAGSRGRTWSVWPFSKRFTTNSVRRFGAVGRPGRQNTAIPGLPRSKNLPKNKKIVLNFSNICSLRPIGSSPLRQMW